MKKWALLLSAALAATGCLAAEGEKWIKDVTHGVVCALPGENFGYFAWPSIAKLGNGTLCVVSSGLRRGHIGPWGRTVICKSTDDGKTWTFPQVINNTPMDDRDPGIVSLGGNRLAVTWFTENADYYGNEHRKPDGSWKDTQMASAMEGWTGEMVEREIGSFIRISNDGESWGEIRRAPVHTPHGFIVLKDGSWLYFGKKWEYVGEGLKKHESDDTPIIAVRSTDEGRSWTELGSVPLPAGLKNDQCWEPHVVQLRDGSLLGGVRVANPFTVMLTRSKDGGKTWSTLESVGCPGSPPHFLLHSSGAIICTVGCRLNGQGQRCMISRDGGKTWDTDLILRNDGPNGDLGYPASVELPDGSIFTVYYQYLPNQNKASILYTKWRLPEK